MAKRELPPARGICNECLSNLVSNGLALAVYCPHNAAGALMLNDSLPGVWRIFSPISPEQFGKVTAYFTEEAIWPICQS